MTDGPGRRRRLIATAAGLTAGGAAYLLTLLDYGTRLTRTANELGYASNFFDFQARALMDGHLWVQEGALGIEAFEVRGREYMYFGPWPAVLRIPVLAVTSEFDGKLTLISMALGFVLMMVMTTKLVWLVRDLLLPGREVDRLEAVAMAVLLAVTTGGTTLTYVASLPWAYHEVYAWAVPFAVGGMYWIIRVLDSPGRAEVGWLLAFGLGAILTRTTGGWGIALATVLAGVWLLSGRLHRERRRIGAATLGAGVLVLAVGVTLNMVKFRHPYLFPLEDQVWTSVSVQRQAALEANGGTITGAQFFPSAFMAYFRLDGVRFVDYFPWITLPATPAAAYGDAVIDQSYRTGSVTSLMPWPLLLTIVAALAVFRPGADQPRRILRVPLVAGVLITGGVMAYGYMANRYTSEFVPALVLGAAIGTPLLTSWARRRGTVVVRSAVGVSAVLTAYSIAAQMLIGHAQAAVVAGGPNLASYLRVQHAVSADEQATRTTVSDDLPSGGRADDLWIRGDCEALYLNTGDRYEPWQVVEQRSVVAEVSVRDRAEAGRVALVELNTSSPHRVLLETNGRLQARVLIQHGSTLDRGAWFDLLEPAVVRVGVRHRPELGYAEVSASPGGFIGFLPARETVADVVPLVELSRVAPPPRKAARLGLDVDLVPGVPPPLCRDLLGAVADTEAGS